VLHPGCRVVINIGDQFLRAATYGRYRVLPIREAIVRQFEALGHDYMGAIIWRKVTTQNSTGGAAVMGSFPYPRNGILKLDYEFILVFRKPGAPPRVTEEMKRDAALSTEEWGRFFAGHWEFPGERLAGHHAAFPVELPLRAIRMFSFPGETVLDPFAGSGTTLHAAWRTGRSAVGYELSPEFRSVIEARVGLAPVRFETRQGHAPAATSGDRPFFGSAVTLAQKGKPRAPLQRVETVTGPVSFRTMLGGWRLEGVTGEDERPLREMIERQRVVIEPTTEGRAYVWLKNRTFVNARLLRDGALRTDPERAGHPKEAVLERASRAYRR